MNIKQSMLLTLMAIAPWALASADTTSAEFSYAPSSLNTWQWGTEKPYETYDIAIRLENSLLVGKKITGMTVPVPSSPYITDLSGWLTSELKLSGKNNVPDIVSVAGTVENGMLNITFPEPYTITENGVYVGYSLTVGSNAIQGSAMPIACVSGEAEGSFYVHTSRVWMSWSDLSNELSRRSSIVVNVEGDFNSDAVGVVSLPNIMADPDVEVNIPVTLRNDGLGSISSIEYDVEINGVKSNFSKNFDKPIMERFLLTESVELPIGIINSVGRTQYTLTVTSVNGKPNNSASASASGNVDVVSFRPVNRPLLEEYTAFTCGYCPRGIAAFERMYELYPDEFIGVAYHDDDAIAFTTTFPNPAPALPTAWMNRSEQCDPYFGKTEGYFGIEDFWKEIQAKEVPVSIELRVGWTDENKTKVTATADVIFVRPVDQQYSLTYLLVSGGISNPDWYQSNYYSGASPTGWIEEMNRFFSAEKMMRGLVYDDIVAMSAPIAGIEGSLPESPEPYKINTHTYEFDLEKAYSRDRVNLVPDKNKVKVVGIVLDAEGKAVNSFMAAPSFTEIDTIEAAEAEVIKAELYDLSGRRLESMPESGIYIVREILINGMTRSHKVVL